MKVLYSLFFLLYKHFLFTNVFIVVLFLRKIRFYIITAMQRLADKKVDLIAVYKLDSNDELLKLLKDIQGSFSWTVRAGGKKGTLLLFLKANASVRRRVESECSNLSDYFSAHYSTPSIEKVLIPHNHRYNKELLHDLTSSYSLTNQQLTSIKNSFGVNVAFYFAFLRAYFRSLVLPALVGVGCWYTQTAFSASYALFVSVYAVAFVEYWRVQERVLSVEWGCDGARSVELANKENEARWYVREARVLLSVPVLLLFAVLLAALLTSWVDCIFLFRLTTAKHFPPRGIRATLLRRAFEVVHCGYLS